jgi:hypothetical protein
MRFLVVKQLLTPPSAMLPAPEPWRSLHLIAYVNLIFSCNVETTHALGLPMTLSLLFRVDKFIRCAVEALTLLLGTYSRRTTFANEIYTVPKGDSVKTQQAFGHRHIDSMVRWPRASVEFDVRSLYVL